MNPDRALVESALAGVPGAFEALVREHQGLSWSIVYRMVRHAEDARELCQEVFLNVYRHLHQYRYDSPLKAWIGRIAFHVALRHLERKRLPIVEIGHGEPEDGWDAVASDIDLERASIAAQEAGMLRSALERLAPLQRTLLTLYHLEELSIPEIAAIAALPEGTVKSHLFRARVQLRAILLATIGGYGERKP